MLREEDSRGRNYLIDFLVICFGVSAWVEINGLWVEAPVLVQRLPEGWKLTSFIVVLSQLGNVGPVLYSVLKYRIKHENLNLYAIHATLIFGSICCLLLSLFWNTTANIFGENRSIVFLILTASLAFVDCTTSVLYLPFMANFHSKYFVSYLVGEGCSGLIPSIVSLIQGIHDSPICRNYTETVNGVNITINKAEYPGPRFSASIFFAILTVVMTISYIAFCFLSSDKSEAVIKNCDTQLTSQSNTSDGYELFLDRKTCWISLILQTYICALTNGILPAIQSYSTLPYGSLTFHLSVNLSVIANPIACFFAFFKTRFANLKATAVFVALGSLCAAYILTVSLLSSQPLLKNNFGSFLIVIVWVVCISTFSYSKATIAAHLRHTSSRTEISLFWYGVCTQLGSVCGAVTIFVAINFSDLFVASQPCV